MKNLKSLLITVIIFLVTSQSVFADAVKGYDILARARENDQVVRQNILPGTAEGVLQGTFGDVIPHLEGDINTGKLVAFRAHLNNYTCIRNHNCEAGEPKITDLDSLRKRAQAFEALHQRHPNVGCYLSPWLEHDIKDQAVVNQWFQIVKAAAPSCQPDCSYGVGYCPPTLIERHGNQAHGDIVSNDGESLWDSDSVDYWKHATILVLGWIHHENNRRSGEKTWTPPSKRPALLTAQDIQQINALMQQQPPAPPAPAVCKKVIDLKKPQLLKSNSEDYGQGNPRDDKPVLLVTAKYKNGLGVLSPLGQKVACASNVHNLPPLGNLNRYYLGECSNKANIRVLKEAGSEYVFYRNGNICYRGNAIRRVGYSR